MMLLQHMQSLIAQLNDVHVTHDVSGYVISHGHTAATDEQVYVVDTADGVDIALYIDPVVLSRLQMHNPIDQLTDANLADFCTALEGVSHFQYLSWCIEHGRSVSLIELELQAEVDKYTTALWLLLKQTCGYFPHGLHARMFSHVSFAKGLDPLALNRYEEANRHAALYCQQLDQRYLRCRQRRVEKWMRELSGFYRSSHHAKLRRAVH
jgi:hypothetical protein